MAKSKLVEEAPYIFLQKVKWAHTSDHQLRSDFYVSYRTLSSAGVVALITECDILKISSLYSDLD